MAIEGTVDAIPKNTSSTPADSSAGLFNDALQYVNELVFGKEESTLTDIITVNATVTPPTSETLSAIDAYDLFFLAPASSRLESPWKQEPIWKYFRFTLALVRFSTWHVLEFLGVFDFVQKYCPIVGQILPFIFFEALPWSFKYTKLVTTVSGSYIEWLADISDNVPADTVASLTENVENVKNVGAWTHEHVARFLMYTISYVTALEYRDWQIVILAVMLSKLNYQFHANRAASQHTLELLELKNTARGHMFHAVARHFSNFRNAQNRLSFDFQEHRKDIKLLQGYVYRTQKAILSLQSHADRLDEAIDEINQEQSRQHHNLNHLLCATRGYNRRYEARFRSIENKGRALRTGIRQLQQRVDITENRISIVEARTDLHRQELAQLGRDAEMERIRTDIIEEETNDRLATLGDGIIEVLVAAEANDLDVRVIREEGTKLKELVGNITALSVFALILLTYVLELVGNVKDQVTDAGNMATKAQQNAINARGSATNAQGTAANARRFATELKRQVDTILEQHNDIKEWATEANTKFVYLCSETVKVLTAIAALKGTAVLAKNQIIVLFDKIDPEMAKMISKQWITLSTQAVDELKIERWQSEAIRLINERLHDIQRKTGLRKQENLPVTPLKTPIRNQVQEVLLTPAPLFGSPTTNRFRGKAAYAQARSSDARYLSEDLTIDSLLEELQGAQPASYYNADPFVDTATPPGTVSRLVARLEALRQLPATKGRRIPTITIKPPPDA
ncbi:hypothetical protein SLS60_002426 [Paraconiothyrium brasiliense]|uniref:Uncharacterized protein n=1 Tax=Paraconiothyrium brasiliense TaxID=300254 RepID=A0ABR3S240_9PLEO